MKLSVIIVNYNVKYFLEQALQSVRIALKGIEGEVFVVDNNSVDDSVAMVEEKFPEVHLIANSDNPGFSKANNQAIKLSKGEYVLLLNPDTVVEEDTFKICIDFMDKHPKAGGLGVKMIDGAGNFLPESKRGFPSPFVAFCKMFGLSKIFPKSKTFNRYHLGYLDKNENHEIEVLAGAFMLLRKSVLDEIGLLDETFFMYGEDIDLSYRIIKAGYKNYYVAKTSIIHYKGESTKKGSLNYVRTFYNAMIIFAQKHFHSGQARMLTFLLRIAIYFRAFLTLVNNLTKRLLLPLADGIGIFFGMILLKNFWASYYFGNPNYYQPEFTYFNIPLYTGIWMGAAFIFGAYDKPLRWGALVRGLLVGTLLLSAIYGFLDLSYRTSRVLIILGFFLALLVMTLVRLFAGFLSDGSFAFGVEKPKSMVIVGGEKEGARALSLLEKVQVDKNFIGRVAPPNTNDPTAISKFDQLDEVVLIYKIEEVIFCSEDVPAQKIMKWMSAIGSKVDFKIIPSKSESIIGSSSKNLAGELYTIDIRYDIILPGQKRNKRMLDFGLSFLFILLTPLLIFLQKRPSGYLGNLIQVLLGKKSLVGYANDPELQKLPMIKKGLLSPISVFSKPPKKEAADRLNFFYARDYRVEKDVEIIWKSIKKIGDVPINQ